MNNPQNKTESEEDFLVIAGQKIKSRLITGSGKYRDDRLISAVLAAAQCDIITVALRRIDFDKPHDSVLNFIPPGKIILPNTSGARNAAEAVRIARLARGMNLGAWIKIEVINDAKYLMPDSVETIKAAEELVKEGFIVLPYIYPDLSVARRLADIGVAAVMPLGAPIGSNRGLQTVDQIRLLIEEIDLPVIVDAGIGAPSHAAAAMEMGAAAVLLNTAIASSHSPVAMAAAFYHAVLAGRAAFLAGLGPQSDTAVASSPLTGFLE
ncbi:MAG: thiazole synthase [Chitinivibrionales bacterium]|nr:thiazole synthase [Chitinivibrionales bacterium]